jgi:uncharacterized protein YgbK (DUF1537 family)
LDNTARILADDATGALECGALLAAQGRASRIFLGAPDPSTSLQILDLECRHGDARLAAAATLAAAVPGPLFVKTDSTLRGNIAAQLLALRQTRPVLYVPAYPRLGRTVIDGQLLVDGRPLHETEFARDIHHPARSSDVASLFPPGMTSPLHRPEPDTILIADAATDADLAAIARTWQERYPEAVIASPAGFIPYWAQSLLQGPELIPKPRAVRKWILVCGSLHPVSIRQAEVAADQGMRVLSGGPASVLAQEAAVGIRGEAFDGVIVFGGDTAHALWRALDLDALTPLAELLPGIAVSQGGEFTFVTKAGGFGSDNAAAAIMERYTQL